MEMSLKNPLKALCYLLVLVCCGYASLSYSLENKYNIEVQSLTTADCARCHSSQFASLKNNGGKHQEIACSGCHQQYHEYNPRKNNYADIMPKCSQCHEGPHGDTPDLPTCLSCHTNPHMPIASLPKPVDLEPKCAVCHPEIAKIMADNPSKHAARKCSDCHSRFHGRKPDCSECHNNHSPKLPLRTADCLTCHPVHNPLDISYPQNQTKKLCAGCHEQAYNLLTINTTKHATFTCAFCHPRHGEIPKCSKCHGERPHNPAIHQKFPDCLSCHNSPHDLKL